MKTILTTLVRLYQQTLSPDHGVFRFLYPNGFCRFYPTCSEYAKKAIEIHGPARGTCFTFLRLLRCHPWSEPAVDPVPRRH